MSARDKVAKKTAAQTRGENVPARAHPRTHPSVRTRKRTPARTRAREENIPLSGMEDLLKPATVAQKRAFLEAVFDGEKQSVALARAHLKWRQVAWVLAHGRHHDAEFEELYKEALRIQQEWRQIQREEKADSLALEGWDEPVYYMGKQIDSHRRFSERMLELQLKRGAPAAYADRVEHSGSFNVTTAIPEPAAPKV